MNRRSLTLLTLTALGAAACSSSGRGTSSTTGTSGATTSSSSASASASTGGSGTGTGTSSSGTSSVTVGSTGGQCTNQGGPSGFTGEDVGACVLTTAACGDLACTDFLGAANATPVIAGGASVAEQQCTGPMGGRWFGGVRCPQVLANLAGGCETIAGASSATDSWYSSTGPGECWECLPCTVSHVACLLGSPTVTECETPMPTTVTAGSSGGFGSGSTSGSAVTTNCSGTLSGGPVSGEPTYACLAQVVSQIPAGFSLRINPVADDSDGGWGSLMGQVFLNVPSPATVSDGTYSAGDGGDWQAEFADPAGFDFGTNHGIVGSISFTVTGIAANDDLGGSATAMVPMCTTPQPGCDGGYLTAHYLFIAH